MSFDLTPIPVKKADGTTVPMIAYSDGVNEAFAHASLNSTGAIINPATADNQTTGNSALATIASQTSGVATAAKQDTGNTSLATVASTNTNLDTNLGAKADTAATTDTGTFSLIALTKRLLSTSTTMSTAHGAPGDAAVTNPASSASIIASLKGVLTACLAATPAGTNLIGKVGVDQTTPGTTNRVASYRVPQIVAAAAPITRPADTAAYAAGDFVGASTTAGSNTSANAAFIIPAARAIDLAGFLSSCMVKKSGTSLLNAIFALHLFSEDILAVAGIADNAVFTPSRYTSYLGKMDMTFTQASSGDCIAFCNPYLSGSLPFKPISGTQNIHALIECRAAYTPVSGEIFTLLQAVTE